MAEYADEPIELWQTPAWGSLIRATSGDFAVSTYLKFLFPGDFVQVNLILLYLDFPLSICLGQIIFISCN